MTCRFRASHRFAALLCTLLLAGAAHAQLTVTVTPVDVDDEDPACFMFGTVATQAIDVTNRAAQAVTATLQCSVPSGLLRVSGVDPSRTIAAGATETMRCGLYDFQDPPDIGASVTDFTVDVNGATSTHTVKVQCRPHQSPVRRCAAMKIRSAGQVGGASLRALARYVKTGRSEPFVAALARGEQRLVHGFGRADARYGHHCADPGDLPTLQQALDGMAFDSIELLGGAHSRCDAGRVRAASSWYGASLRAWSRSQRRGDTAQLVRALVGIDRKFQRRWNRLGQPDPGACSPIDVNALRSLVDRPIHTVLDAQGARRPSPEQWQAALVP
jgi:hypothetical protein